MTERQALHGIPPAIPGFGAGNLFTIARGGVIQAGLIPGQDKAY